MRQGGTDVVTHLDIEHIDESLRNLYRHTARVFETILMGESRTILKRVKLARQDPIFPRIRAKYQLVGESLAEML